MSRKIVAIVIAILIVAGFGAYQYVERSRQLPEGLIQANGRIEGDTIIIASKQPGKVTAVHVHEGDDVAAGQVLVELDDEASRARVAEADAAKMAAIAQVEQCRAEYEVLCEEVPYGIDAATAAVTASQARLQQAQSAEQQAEKERERYWTLAESSSVGWETAERADLKWRQAIDAVTAARAMLTQANDTLKEAQLGPTRITAKQAQTAAFEAAADAAQARLEEAQSVVADLTIASPASGAVTLRLADLGEVINAGTPLLEVVDLDRCTSRCSFLKWTWARCAWVSRRRFTLTPSPTRRLPRKSKTSPRALSSRRRKSKHRMSASNWFTR